MKPRRIQRKRTKGWRMPEGAVYVGRPTRWGNPWPLDVYRYEFPDMGEDERRAYALKEYRGWISGWVAERLPWLTGLPDRPDLAELRGHDLACWCPLDQPCHADVLLELANG